MANKKSCYSCKFYYVCGCRQGIDESIKKVRINIDKHETVKGLVDIFDTMGEVCLTYEEEEKK